MSLSFQELLLHNYTDSLLISYIRQSPIPQSSLRISLLSPNLVSKSCPTLDSLHDTVYAMELAQRHGIRVPAVKRTIRHPGRIYYIMQRIHGVTLDEAWPRLGIFTSLRLALSLRRGIRKLRDFVAPDIGSLVTGKCRSFWLADYFGLPMRCGPAEIRSFVGFWANFKSMGQAASPAGVVIDPNVYTPDIPDVLIFSHTDLSPRNMMLDRDGELWVLDWKYAGYYPPFFEYVGMHNFDPWEEGWGWFARLRWKIFSWIVVGRWEVERCFMERIRYRFTRNPTGRRYWILKHGGPSAREIF